MINIVLQAVGSFFVLMLTAMTIENTVLARSLGISRLISLLDETSDTIVFGTLLTIITILSGVLYYLTNTFFLANLPYKIYMRPFIMVVCMGVAFAIVFVLVVKFAPYEYLAKAVEALPLATFNCTVVGTLLIMVSATLNFSLAGSIAYGIGSSVGFVLAVALVTEGQRKLQNRDMPSAFKGLPATLLFIAGIALAIYGLTGYTFVF